ncbi:MAG: alpha-mannosidase [bacterium]
MTAKKRIHIVSHTHWDREWYLTLEEYRIKLVDLVGHLLDVLEKDPDYKYFMLDGQTIILEDYLKIKPENKERLKKLIAKGRVLIGPWYILPDEFLVSAESYIRNLLQGDKICREFGGKMEVGYLPDSFGHIAQMPQLLKGFGIESAVIWRGVGKEVKETEFTWQAPDGSKALTVYLPFGYCTGAALPFEVDDCERRIKWMVEKLSPLATTNLLLLMNGCDHLEPQPHLPCLIAEVNKKMDSAELVHSSLPMFFKELREKVCELPIYRKEWRSGERTIILTGTLSSRMYLKQWNKKVQILLEKWVEPFSTFAYLAGKPYPSSLIWHAWRYLLKNHAHDSICGCGVDEVHEEMIIRFKKAQQVGEELCSQAINYLAANIDTANNEVNLVVFNPLPNRRTDLVEATVELDSELIRRADWQAGRLIEIREKEKTSHLPPLLRMYDEENKEIPSSIEKVERVEKIKCTSDDLPQVYRTTRYRLTLLARDVPGLGYRTYRIRPSYEKEKEKKPEELKLENEYLKVTPNLKNGTLDIYDKETKRSYKDCNLFVDGGDAGDEYTYSPPCEETLISSAEAKSQIKWEAFNSVRSTLRIEIHLELPVSLSEDRKKRSYKTVDCPITSYVSLYPGVKRVDVKTVVENKAKDHRLRVIFPTEIETDTSYAEGHFQVVSRKISSPETREWMEKSHGINPQQNFVNINSGDFGLTIANQGLPEYEIVRENHRSIIALTLLRCVGWLSQDGLLTRKGHAAWPFPTPGAQCLGTHTFHYSLIPHRGDWQKARTFIEAHGFNTPMRCWQTRSHKGKLPSEISLVEIKPESLILSALKKAEEGEAIILRIYNTVPQTMEGSLSFFFPLKEAYLAGLNERRRERLKIQPKNFVKLKVKGFEIITLYLVFKKNLVKTNMIPE